MHPWDQVLEGKVWVFDFFCFQRVPMEFSLCSHQVPCEFPKFPIAPHFIHILCHKFYSCNLHKQPKGGDCNISILELFKVGFIFLMGQSKMPITERKKKELQGSPQTNQYESQIYYHKNGQGVLCKGYQPRPKMVNSFGKLNFMQPMERPKHAVKVPCFFPFKVWGGGGIFFVFPQFPMCSQYVPFKLQWVPIRFSKCSSSSQCVPQHVLHSNSLLSHIMWQMLSSLHLYRLAKGEEL